MTNLQRFAIILAVVSIMITVYTWQQRRASDKAICSLNAQIKIMEAQATLRELAGVQSPANQPSLDQLQTQLKEAYDRLAICP